MSDPFAGKAVWFDEHYRSVRGRVRLELVIERLAETLPPAPARILDVGGGTGAFAIALARRGHDVMVIDRSSEWLDRCRQNARAAGVTLELRQLDAVELAGAGLAGFDAILCHAVLMYVDAPPAILRHLHGATRSGGLLSLLEKNRDGIALRPGLEGDFAEARRLLTERAARGRMGIENLAYSVEEWLDMLRDAGWEPTTWAGIRLFSDTAPDDLEPRAFKELLELEREAGGLDPYRRMARLIHVMARNEQ